MQSDIPGLVGHWRTQARGYDSNQLRLTDLSGFSNHLPLVQGTPDFTQTKGGHTGWKMHGDAMFGRENILPPCFTFIIVEYPALNAGNTFYPLYATHRTYTDLGDPAWQSPTDSLTTTPPTNGGTALMFRLAGTAALFGDLTFKSVSTTFTSGAWNVFSMVLQPQGGFRKLAINNGTPQVSALPEPTLNRNLLFNAAFFLGLYPAAPITTSGGESNTCLQAMLYVGDLFLEQATAWGNLAAALMANPEL
jgi:hypothetical protein